MAGSRLKTYIVAVFAVIGLISCVPSVAGEIAIYESLADVTIGRVFLSPRQRAHLDSRPVESPKPVREPAPAEPVERKKNSAGYIISSSGESSVWSRQGFVTKKDASAVAFPGDVKVIRKEIAESSDFSSTELRKPVSGGKPEAVDNGA